MTTRFYTKLPALLRTGTQPIVIGIILFSLSFSAANANDELQSLISACADGDMTICDQINDLQRSEEPASGLDAMAIAFAKRAPNLGISNGELPDLEKAYDLIVRDYFSSEKISVENRAKWFREKALPSCATHYHTRWRFEKNWWPVKEDNSPDWRTIYPHALDHYFGFCVTQ